jgi:hypothetical protein
MAIEGPKKIAVAWFVWSPFSPKRGAIIIGGLSFLAWARQDLDARRKDHLKHRKQ